MHTRQLVFLVLLFISSVHALSVQLSLQKVPDDIYIIHDRYIVSWIVKLEPGEDKGDGKLYVVKQSGKGGLSDDPIEASFNQSLVGEGSFGFGGVGPYKLVAYRIRVGDLSYADRVGEIGDFQVIARPSSTTATPSPSGSSPPTNTKSPVPSVSPFTTPNDITAPQTASEDKPHNKDRTGIIVGAVLGPLLLILLGVLIWHWRRSRTLDNRLGDLESQLGRPTSNASFSHNRSTSSLASTAPLVTIPQPVARLFSPVPTNNNASQSETTITAFPYYVPPPRYDSGVEGRMVAGGKQSLRDHSRNPSNGSTSSAPRTPFPRTIDSNTATTGSVSANMPTFARRF